MPLDVLFRADASLEIGTGHVMRCLTFADVLRKAGAYPRFACRDLPGHLAARIEEHGYPVNLLPPPPRNAAPAPPPHHAAWLPVSQEEDAAEIRAIGPASDWIVVDHYALDARWQTAAAGGDTRVMAIDDLADRPHAVDLLLDQTLGRTPKEYSDWAPGAAILAGAQYALLRPEFAALRTSSLARRTGGTLRHVLIAMGGTDAHDTTAKILDTISDRTDLRLTVVMGANAPTLEKVHARVRALGDRANLLVDTPDIAQAMTEADLAIGAGGTTSWERCALGLPTLLLMLADNQVPSARALAAAGAASVIGSANVSGWQDTLRREMTRVSNAAALATMSRAAAAICDGRGAERTLHRFLAATPTLRAATRADSRLVWEWRNFENATRFYRSPAPSPFIDHDAWFARALTEGTRALLIAEYRGEAVGHLRLDFYTDYATVSIVMAPAARGRGLGRVVLEAGLRHAVERGANSIHAEIHADNAASIRLFESAAFRATGTDKPFIHYRREALQ